MELYHSPWSEVYNHDRTNTGLVLPPVSRVPGSIALDPPPSSDPGAAFQGNFRLAINSLGTLKAPPRRFHTDLVDLSQHREFPPPKAEHVIFATRFALDSEIHSPVAPDQGKSRASAVAARDFWRVRYC
jgi:hypothetical protein